jgi:lipopolysaccharide biosynthesis regulator YciM
MFELLWLLLPLAAASGWFMARRGQRCGPPESGKEHNPAYFRGLNHLLNEEPDKAIDVFVQMLEVDSDTVETHLALGNLFRRRGEVDRAIRIHQNLIARPALTREQRAQALLELGQDYMRAGLYDRAENLFKELRDSRLNQAQALRNLLVIYQQEKDWEACLNIAEELAPLSQDTLWNERAHYYCELASKAIQLGHFDRANALLRKALSAHKQCVRALHMQADIAIRQNDWRGAIRLLKRAGELQPDYLREVLPQLVECHKRLDDLSGLRSYLDGVLAEHPESCAALFLADLLNETEGEAVAAAFLSEEVNRHPSLRGLKRLAELQTGLPDSKGAKVLETLRGHITELLRHRPGYRCTQCGFEAKTLHWQCPSCRSWGTIKPRTDNEEQRPITQ